MFQSDRYSILHDRASDLYIVRTWHSVHTRFQIPFKFFCVWYT